MWLRAHLRERNQLCWGLPTSLGTACSSHQLLNLFFIRQEHKFTCAQSFPLFAQTAGREVGGHVPPSLGPRFGFRRAKAPWLFRGAQGMGGVAAELWGAVRAGIAGCGTAVQITQRRLRGGAVGAAGRPG